MRTATRRGPTQEQRDRAARRREMMRDLADRIALMTPEAREALALQAGIVTIEGRPLSPFNCCMIVSQVPHATVVGGFRQWLSAGRAVRKGEHGAAIWVPISGGSSSAGDEGEPGPQDMDAGTAASGAPRRPRFVLGTVFDITQTDPTEQAAEAGAGSPAVPA